MKRLFFGILMISFLSIEVYAGFWSSALGTVVGIASSENASYYTDKDAKEEPKKIQQTLSKLGFFSGKFDGNLNSFNTRSSIEEFQAYYNLEDTGILSKAKQNDLLYMHDLIKNYRLELETPKEIDSKRLLKIYKSFDKLEKKLSKNKLNKSYMTVKLKQEIKDRRAYLAKKEYEYNKAINSFNTEERKLMKGKSVYEIIRISKLNKKERQKEFKILLCVKDSGGWIFGDNMEILCR